ncbi:MAG: formate dehydrogenase accessory sulfurtransferase FdhD, partial [Bradyrhizobium sp.]
MVYDGSTYAVMMATPEDMEDFAIGFSLTEGVVRRATDIKSIDLVRSRDGIELRMWLAGSNSLRLGERRRRIAGPSGCGLCGIESLAESIRPAEIVGEGRKFASRQIIEAMQSILPLQRLNIETRAVHAAAFWQPVRGVVA